MFRKFTILIVLSVFALGAWAQNTSPTPAKPADKS
jgi:hypothetical protein